MEKMVLRNGVEMPALGLGVYQVRELDVCEDIVLKALQMGYRLIDTAQSYGNEEAVGRAIIKSGVPREEIFVTTKLKIANLTYEKAKKSFFESLKKLQLKYVDLLLIHHPYNDVYGAWRAMQELYRDGYVRAIGLSNFPPDRLEDMVLHGGEIPHLMQVEIQPFFQQNKIVELMNKHRIQAEAWSPLAQGKFDIFKNEILVALAQKYGKTPAQVILRWLYQRNIAIVVKTVREERLKENMDIFDFELSQEEMQRIASLDRNESVMPQIREPYWIDTLSSF